MGLMRRLGLPIAIVAATLALLGTACGATKPVAKKPVPAPKPTQARAASALFLACHDLRCGFIDRTGKVVISGYDETGDYSEGLAAVGVANKYGFVDTAGKVVIPIQQHGVGKFSSGLAAVYVGDGKWGYLDKTGKMAIKPVYDWAEDFGEGLAAVKVGEKFGAIDKTGTMVIQPNYDSMGSLSNGLMAAKQDGKWGFIDKAGAVVISPQFDETGAFSGGLAPAKSGVQWGYVDKTGKWVVEPKYAAADPFSEGMASVGKMTREMLKDEETGRVVSIVNYIIRGYIDTSGNEIIPLEYKSAGAFSEGVAPVLKKDEFTFIDKTGKTVVSSAFGKDTGSLHNGLARTTIGTRYGYINESGKTVIPQQFTEAREFSEGLAAVAVNGYGPYGYVDTSGRWVVKPQFTHAFSFRKGLARVRGELHWGLIDKTGKYVLEPNYGQIGWVTDKVIAIGPKPGRPGTSWSFNDRTGQPVLNQEFEAASFLGDTLAVVKKDGKFGVVDTSGKLVVPTEYDDAGWLFAEGLLPVREDGKYGFVDATGKMVIQPQYDAVGGFTPEKLCAVRVGGKWGFVDIAGKAVIAPQFDTAVCFSEGLTAVKAGDKWGFVDKTGQYIAKPQYDLAGNFYGGMAAVQVGEKWGYVDKTGKLAIPAKFDKALDFANGLAQVRIGNQSGYINRTGTMVWKSRQYASAATPPPAPSRAKVQVGSDGVRVVKVKVAGDQVLQQRSDWKTVLERRMQAASDLLEKSFEIRLSLAEVVPWTTPEFKQEHDPDSYGDLIYDKLIADIPMDDAEIIIGFTGRDSRSTMLGFTHTYGEHIIMYDPYNGDESREAQIVITIAHEICHDFGGFHVPVETSIMNAFMRQGGGQTGFDQDTTRQMDLMRDYDLAKGIDSLSADKIKKAAEIYTVAHAPDVPFPVAKAHMYRGLTRKDAGDIAGAIRDFREAVKIDGDRPDMAHVYRLGKTLLDDGQTVLGIETMRKCYSLTTDPEDAGMWHNRLASDMSDQAHSDVAFLTCQQASRPRLGEIYQRYVLTRISPDEVVSEYQEAVKASPKVASYHFKLGEALADRGRFEEALAEYDQAAVLEPENTYYKSRAELVKAKTAGQSK